MPDETHSHAATGKSNVLTYLTVDDRALLHDATGVTLNADGVDEKKRALAPALAFTIAHDRKSGKLPEGQPITSTYLRNMLDEQMGSGSGAQDVVDGINKMLDVLATRGGHEWVDYAPERSTPPCRLSNAVKEATAGCGG